MKNSILFVSGLWAFSVLVGKSCPSVIYSFNTDDSNDGAISAKNSNTLDLPRDMSQPIIARFARDIKGEDHSTSPKFNLLILIIPCVLGVVVIIIIVLVVCYTRRQSGRSTCISNEWLIWCGLMKRGNRSPVPDPGGHRQAYAPGAQTGQSAMPPTRDDDGESVVRLIQEELTGACPSERSPSLPGTPNNCNSSLPTDDEDRSTMTKAMMHPSGTQPKDTKFRFPNHPSGTHVAMDHTLEIIRENENTNDGRDNDGSGLDDDVCKPGGDGVSDTLLAKNLLHGRDTVVSHHEEGEGREREHLLPNEPNYANGSFLGDTRPGDHSNHKWQREPPSRAPPGDTHREINGENVFVFVGGNAQFDVRSPVENFQVGNRKINNNFFPHDVPDSRHNTSAFNRSSNERQTR